MGATHIKLFASIGFPLCSIFFLLFIVLMFMNKKKFKSTENSIFKALLFMSFVCNISEFVYVLFIYYELPLKIQIVACKLFLIFMTTWINFFMGYIYALITKKYEAVEKKKRRKI